MSRKTLNQILKQNTFTGADVGKAKLMNFVSRFANRKELIGEGELASMAASVRSTKQLMILKAYTEFTIYLENFYTMLQGSIQQVWHGIEHIMLLLSMAKTHQIRYLDYLAQPLTLTEAEYNTFKKKAIEAFYKEDYTLDELIRHILIGAVDLYKDNAALKPELKALEAVFKKYEKEQVRIQKEAALSEIDAKTLIDLYAKTYNVYKDMKQMLSFILDKMAADLEGKPRDKIFNRIFFIESMGDSYQAEEGEGEYLDMASFKREAEETFEKLPTEAQELFLAKLIRQSFTMEIQKLTKINNEISYTTKRGNNPQRIEALKKARSEIKFVDFIEPEISVDTNRLEHLTEELLKGYIPIKETRKAFPEVFTAIAPLEKELGKKKGNKYSMKDLAPLGINAEQNFLNIEEAIEDEITAKYSGDTQKDFIYATKAIRGVWVAPEGSKAPEIPEWAINFDITKTMTYKGTSLGNYGDMENIKDNEVSLYISTLIAPALKGILGINTLFDVYGDLLKVNLNPLKANITQITERIKRYNACVYQVYDDLQDCVVNENEGSDKFWEKCQKDFMAAFPTINMEEMKPDPAIVNQQKEKLSNIPIEKCIDPNYFEPFLMGGDIEIEK